MLGNWKMQRNNFSTGEQKGKKSSFSVPLKNYSFRIFSLSSFSLLLHYPLELRGVVGQKAGKKKLIVVALEMQGVEFGKAYAQVIDDVSSKSFKPSFETYINKDTTVITNEWNGYKP